MHNHQQIIMPRTTCVLINQLQFFQPFFYKNIFGFLRSEDKNTKRHLKIHIIQIVIKQYR